MKTIEVTLYKFEELSEDAKQTAIKKWREDSYQNDEGLFWFADSCKEYLRDNGFINPDVQYSLSSSQGDGLSFSAEGYTGLLDLYINELGARHNKIAQLLCDNTTLIIKGNAGHYCYASKSDVDLYVEISGANETPLIDQVIENVQAELTRIYLDACRILENDGYSQIEYEDSDEYISEALISNDYDFTIEGDMY